MNLPWLSVHRKPRVAILSTGDELVMPGEPVGRNQIVSSSGIAVAALVRAWGGEPTLFDIARDDAELIQDAHRRRRPARPPDHPGRRLGRRPRPRPGRAQGAGLRHGFLAHRHAPGKAADVRRQGPRPRARPAGQSGLDHGLRAPVPEARHGPHAGPAGRPRGDRAGAARRRREGQRHRARTMCASKLTRTADGVSWWSPIRAGQLHAVGAGLVVRRCWSGRRTTRRARRETPCRSSIFLFSPAPTDLRCPCIFPDILGIS